MSCTRHGSQQSPRGQACSAAAEGRPTCLKRREVVRATNLSRKYSYSTSLCTAQPRYDCALLYASSLIGHTGCRYLPKRRINCSWCPSIRHQARGQRIGVRAVRRAGQGCHAGEYSLCRGAQQDVEHSSASPIPRSEPQTLTMPPPHVARGHCRTRRAAAPAPYLTKPAPSPE